MNMQQLYSPYWGAMPSALGLVSIRLLPLVLLAPWVGGVKFSLAIRLLLWLAGTVFFSPACGSGGGKAIWVYMLPNLLVGVALALIIGVSLQAVRACWWYFEVARGLEDSGVFRTRAAIPDTTVTLLGAAVFAASGGDRLLLAGIANSFIFMPVWNITVLSSPSIISHIGHWTDLSLSVGIPILSISIAFECSRAAASRLLGLSESAAGWSGLRGLLLSVSTWIVLSRAFIIIIPLVQDGIDNMFQEQ